MVFSLPLLYQPVQVQSQRNSELCAAWYFWITCMSRGILGAANIKQSHAAHSGFSLHPVLSLSTVPLPVGFATSCCFHGCIPTPESAANSLCIVCSCLQAVLENSLALTTGIALGISDPRASLHCQPSARPSSAPHPASPSPHTPVGTPVLVAQCAGVYWVPPVCYRCP